MQWVEKYRPNNLENITSQQTIIQSLKNSIISKNIPHLIFYGASGCGKTSTILALSKELFGSEYSNRIIELNASDERGINIVRDKIKKYAKQAVKLNNDIPPWKIIILDEADTMTPDSQFALRRIIEEYSRITRFCFICNYRNKIIDPIVSRCSLFCFKPISDIDIFNKIRYISIQEMFTCTDNFLHKIVKISRGDLRKAINYLQKCYNPYDESYNNTILDEISGVLPIEQFNNLILHTLNKNIYQVDALIKNIVLDGYSLVNQISLIHDYILNSNFTNKQKSKIILKLTDVEQSLIKGADEHIQFIRIVYFIISVI